MKSFRVQHSDDRVVKQLQESAKEALDEIQAKPIVDGRLIERVDLVSGDNIVDHGLGRKYRAVFVCPCGAVTVTEDRDNNELQSSNVILNASGPVTVDIWVI